MVDFRRDSAGLSSVLKSAEIASAIRQTAERVAGQVRAQGRTVRSGAAVPVKVDSYTTDRAAASVTVTNPAGIGMQAKHGILTKAAAAVGLEVRS